METTITGLLHVRYFIAICRRAGGCTGPVLTIRDAKSSKPRTPNPNSNNNRISKSKSKRPLGGNHTMVGPEDFIDWAESHLWVRWPGPTYASNTAIGHGILLEPTGYLIVPNDWAACVI